MWPLTELTGAKVCNSRASRLYYIRCLNIRCRYKSSVAIFVNHLYPPGTIIFLNNTHGRPL